MYSSPEEPSKPLKRRKKRKDAPRESYQSSGEQLSTGKKDVDSGVNSLLRDRKAEKYNEDIEIEQFIVNDISPTTKLPDFEEVAKKEKEEQESGILDIVEGFLPQKVTEGSNSMDFFEKGGVGSIIKNTIYAFSIGLVLWDVYINSPLFERMSAPMSIDERLNGVTVESRVIQDTVEEKEEKDKRVLRQIVEDNFEPTVVDVPTDIFNIKPQ